MRNSERGHGESTQIPNGESHYDHDGKEVRLRARMSTALGRVYPGTLYPAFSPLRSLLRSVTALFQTG
jgi:hypothetical protein